MSDISEKLQYARGRPDNIFMGEEGFRHGQIVLMQPMSMMRRWNGRVHYPPEFYYVYRNEEQDRTELIKIDWNFVREQHKDRYEALISALDPLRAQIEADEIKRLRRPSKEAAHV